MFIHIDYFRRKEKQLRSLTTDPLLEDHPHDHDDNAAQCNCGAKIYYATRAEMQRQLAMSAMTLRDPPVEGTSDLPDIPASHYHTMQSGGGQGLPMPDMCIVDSRPPGEASESVPSGNSPARQQSVITFKPGQGNGSQDSTGAYNNPDNSPRVFITFKPGQSGASPDNAGTFNNPNNSPRGLSGSPGRIQGLNRTETPISEGILSGDSPKVTSKLLSDHRSSDPRTRYKKVKTLENPYGARLPAGNIYEKRLSQLPCAECAKETINANNINAAQEQAAGNKSV